MSSTGQTCEIALEQAEAGMTLATALLDAHGSVLLPQDAALTEPMLASLRRRGIERCVVWQPADAPDPAVLERQREQRLQRLEHVFRHCADASGSQALLAQLRRYRAQQA
jgi:hypothetical protein